MAFKLTVTEKQDFNLLVEDLRKEQAETEEAVTAANDEISEIVAKLNAKLAEYNSARESLKTFIENKAADFRTEFEEKSDSWQEGDKGQEADEFITLWENPPDLDEVDEFSVDAFEAPESPMDDVDDLPTEI